MRTHSKPYAGQPVAFASEFSVAQQRRVVLVAVLSMLIVVIVVARLQNSSQTLGKDVTFYAVVGHELLNGRQLYSDLWDQKPPATFVTYAAAESLFGYGPDSIFLLDVTLAIVALLGVFYAGKVGGGNIAGILAAAFWAVLCGDRGLEAGEPNSEVFMNAFLIWSFVFLLWAGKKHASRGLVGIVAVLLTIGSFYKPVVAFSALPLVLAHVAFPPGGAEGRREALKDVLVIAGVGIAGWVVMSAYFWGTGRGKIFFDSMIRFNRYYSGDTLANVLLPLHDLRKVYPPTSRRLTLVLSGLAVFVVLAAVLQFFKNRRAAALLVAYALGAWVALAMPGRFYPHYYQLLLPPLVIGAGWSIGILRQKAHARLPWIPQAIGIAVFMVLVLHELLYFRGAPRLNPSRDAAHRVSALLLPGENFFVLGSEPGLYFWSGHRPPSGMILGSHLLNGPLAQQLSERASQDLLRHPPELIVVSIGQWRYWQVEGSDNPVMKLLLGQYRPFTVSTGETSHALYVRRSSSLDARLLAAKIR